MDKIITDNEFLKQKSEPVSSVSEAREIIERLKNVLILHDGLGLSAIQIGIPKQVAIIKHPDGEISSIINPIIVETEDEFLAKGEGCLSFPGFFVNAKRFEHFTIKNQVIDGEVFREETQYYFYDKTCHTPSPRDYEAWTTQHEIDHFWGITIIDKHVEKYIKTIRRESEKVGRNEQCPCGSSKKFKKCCLGNGKYD